LTVVSLLLGLMQHHAIRTPGLMPESERTSPLTARAMLRGTLITLLFFVDPVAARSRAGRAG
jgi:hypothetical protein